MRVKKVLSAISVLALCLASFGTFAVLPAQAQQSGYKFIGSDVTPPSGPEDRGIDTSSINPPATLTCTPGFQEPFSAVDNARWGILFGNPSDIFIYNDHLYQTLHETGDLRSLAGNDIISGDFEMDIDIAGVDNYNALTDSLYIFLEASADGDNYMATSLDLTPSGNFVEAFAETGGVDISEDPINIGDITFPVTIKVKRQGSVFSSYIRMDNSFYLVASINGAATGDMFVTINSNFYTSVDHDISVKINNFRYGCNLPRFTDFEMNGGLTSTPVSSVIFNNRMYQFIGGNSAPNRIYMRSSADGTFDGTDSTIDAADPKESWAHYAVDGGPGGETSTEIGVAVFNNRLYIAVKGRDSGQVFTKSMGTDGEWDATWNENGGKSGTAIAMAMFNPGSGDRLYQVIKGFSSNNLYYRYTTDGTFNASGSEENWAPIMNQTNIATSPNAPAIESFDSRLYISVRGSSGNINYASTADGLFDSDASDEYFILSGGKTSTTPSLETHSGYLYQITKGNSTDLIYTRYFTTEDGWSAWYDNGGKMPTRGDMTSFDEDLYQTVRGNSGNIFMRKRLTISSFL